jgi:hypothetical protein
LEKEGSGEDILPGNVGRCPRIRTDKPGNPLILQILARIFIFIPPVKKIDISSFSLYHLTSTKIGTTEQ